MVFVIYQETVDNPWISMELFHTSWILGPLLSWIDVLIFRAILCRLLQLFQRQTWFLTSLGSDDCSLGIDCHSCLQDIHTSIFFFTSMDTLECTLEMKSSDCAKNIVSNGCNKDKDTRKSKNDLLFPLQLLLE